MFALSSYTSRPQLADSAHTQTQKWFSQFCLGQFLACCGLWLSHLWYNLAIARLGHCWRMEGMGVPCAHNTTKHGLSWEHLTKVEQHCCHSSQDRSYLSEGVILSDLFQNTPSTVPVIWQNKLKKGWSNQNSEGEYTNFFANLFLCCFKSPSRDRYWK